MDELKTLLEDIEKLRDNLHDLIDRKSTFLDPEIIAASEVLNAAITRYNEVVEKKMRY